MKVLFVGLGRAGQRHLRNLKRLYGENVEIMAYRVRGLQRVFDDNMQIKEEKSLEKEFRITTYSDYSIALANRPDVVFIANRNSEHIKYALEAAQAGCHLFIEKPVSNTLEGIDLLDSIVQQKGKLAYIGYQNRLHPCIKKAKAVLEQNLLGKIYMVSSEQGEYLPKMHPWEDYRKMHESRRELGGGVVLCQLHELDYLYYLFGMPEEVYTVGGKRSSLQINVEDSATALCRYQDGKTEFAVAVHLDFLQYPPVRHCKIAGVLGRMEFDLLGNEYSLYLVNGKSEHKKYSSFQRNDMFLEELDCFMKAVEENRASPLAIHEGKKSVEYALALKKSMEIRDSVRLEK